MLLETNADLGQNYSDALIVETFNRKKDYRECQLQNMGEGFSISFRDADLVANQSAYSLPPEAGRIRRILRYIAGRNLYLPLEREEKWTEATYTGGEYDDASYLPTYRLQDNHIVLDPPPTENVTNGIRIELEAATDRMTLGTDTLPDSWPLFAESLLIYDTVLELVNILDSNMGNADESVVAALNQDRSMFERSWLTYVEKRSFGPQFTQPMNLDLLF